MPSFKYGSRVIENEQQVRLERHVRRIGNVLHAVVRLFVTFFLFILINFLLSSLVQHANLTFMKMLHLVQESAEVLFSQGAAAITTFMYQHSFSLMFVVAFFCASVLELVLIKLLGNGTDSSEREHNSYNRDNCEFNTETGRAAISYRHKVCFLS